MEKWRRSVQTTVLDNTGTKSTLGYRPAMSVHFGVPGVAQPGCGILELLLLIHRNISVRYVPLKS